MKPSGRPSRPTGPRGAEAVAGSSRGTLWTLRVLTILVTAAAVVVAAVGLVSRAGRAARELEDRARQAAGLLAAAAELQARHPDYEFPAEEERLAAYRRLPPRGQGKALAEIQGLCAQLQAAAVTRATGVGPRDPSWEQVRLFKTFSPNGFRDLYAGLRFARTVPFAEAPPVTGDPAADGRISRLAAARGYRLRSDAEQDALAAGDGQRLQRPALAAFRRLQQQAAAEGVRLELVSGYRSAERQRRIFLNGLADQSRRRIGREYTLGEIASGEADAALDSVLAESAPPGFSRHHTGYTLDLNDPSTGKDFTRFGSSPAFRWLAAANYLNAKRFGFIPSYPAGATAQGPEPEPWEFSWVGEELLALP